MDVARCTIDDVKYYAAVFAKLPAAELQLKRRHLVCFECGWPAYFKKEAVSGQGACFGARPHKAGCGMTAPEANRSEGGGDEQDILHNAGNHIVLDLNFGAAVTVNGNPGAEGEPGGRGGRFTGTGTRPNTQLRRRLSTVLRNLIYSEQFRNSPQTIEVPDRGPHAIRDFFVPFDGITEQHVGKFRGYWGVIFDAGAGKNGSIWLNTGKQDDLSVLLSSEQKIELYTRFGIKKLAHLEGAHFLVLGTLQVSKNGTDKRYIKLDDIGYCTLYEG